MLSLPPLPRNLEAAFRDLSSKKVDVRRGAVLDVVKHGLGDENVRQRAVTELVRLLQTDASGQVRASSCVGLADLGADTALPALIVAVEDDDAFVRQMALSALGEIGDPRARGRVERALSDERPELRYQAVIAFARLAKDKDDVATLRRSLVAASKDDDEAVRYIALRLMEEAFQREGPSFLDDAVKARLTASQEDPHVDVVLAGALFTLRASDAAGKEKVDRERLRVARTVISEVVRNGKWRGKAPCKEDEGAAVEITGELSMTELVPDLVRRAYGLKRLVADACTFHAKIALARLGHTRTVEALLADLSSRSLEARTLAVVASGRAHLLAAKPLIEKLAGKVDDALVKEALSTLGHAAPGSTASTRSEGDR